MTRDEQMSHTTVNTSVLPFVRPSQAAGRGFRHARILPASWYASSIWSTLDATAGARAPAERQRQAEATRCPRKGAAQPRLNAEVEPAVEPAVDGPAVEPAVEPECWRVAAAAPTASVDSVHHWQVSSAHNAKHPDPTAEGAAALPGPALVQGSHGTASLRPSMRSLARFAA